MANVKYILTADDYGPVDFVNDGIIHHVKNGTINSVQVLTNFDQKKLNDSVDQLWKAVPNGKSVDVGLHLTLSSGSPLVMTRNGQSTSKIWGDFVSHKKYMNHKGQKVKGYVFTKYSDFYLEYENLKDKSAIEAYEETIIAEFLAQKEQLVKALNHAATSNPGNPSALVFTCVSNHFDFFTLSERLFKIYRDIAGNLAIRPPKRIPLKKSLAYVKALSLFGVGTIAQRKRAKAAIRGFHEYKYSPNIQIKSPGFIDIRLYAGAGGLSELTPFSGFENRFAKLQEIIEESTKSATWSGYKQDKPTVEIVFHLGKTKKVKPNFSIRDVQGYLGVSHKYFDNRLVESRVLNAISNEEDFKNKVMANMVSWNECPKIKYT